MSKNEVESTNGIAIDFKQVVTDRINSVLDSKLDEMLEKQVTTFIQSIFNDIFSSYGDLQKLVKHGISENLKLKLENIKIEAYNDRVMQIIHAELDNHLTERVNKVIAERISAECSILDKTEWKLSEIVKELVESEWEETENEFLPSIFVEKSNYGSIYIGLDKEKKDSYYKCEYQLSIEEKTGEVWNYEIRGYFGSKKQGKSLHGTMERLIFALFANRAKVIIDDYKTEYYRGED